MSINNTEWWIEGNLVSEDMGGMIRAIREDYLKETQETVSEKINVKLGTFQSCENGKGIHIGNVLSRICEAYDLETVIQIKSK